MPSLMQVKLKGVKGLLKFSANQPEVQPFPASSQFAPSKGFCPPPSPPCAPNWPATRTHPLIIFTAPTNSRLVSSWEFSPSSLFGKFSFAPIGSYLPFLSVNSPLKSCETSWNEWDHWQRSVMTCWWDLFWGLESSGIKALFKERIQSYCS